MSRRLEKMTTTTQSSASPSSLLISLSPILAAVFFAFLVAGMALPVLPLHVHNDLGLSTFIVGLVSGSQFAAALLSRMWAGRYADGKGAKHAVIAGLIAASAGGSLYVVSLLFLDNPAWSAAILATGRAVLGGGESFIITGAIGWGLALAGVQHTGRVLAWMGMAMYAAFAFGAPAGTALNAAFGFASIAWETALIPLLVLILIFPMRSVAPMARKSPPFLEVLRAVWLPGTGLALSSLGFGSITAFSALLFAQNEWEPAWPAFTAFAGCFMLARFLFGGHVDRIGGARVALLSIGVEAVGLLMLWGSRGPVMAVIGAGLTGLGYSLIFPGLGVEAVRRAPANARALAMGAYTACLDLALGLGMPLLGLLAGRLNVQAVFLISAAGVSSASIATLHLMRRSSTTTPSNFETGSSK